MSDRSGRTMDRGTLLRRGAAAGGALTLGGLLPTLASAHRESTTLNLVAYSTPKPVMSQLITNWQSTPQGQGVSFTQSYGPSTSHTVVVFALRDGNPKKIKGWNDLVEPGVRVITPSPWSSGSAKWNILAAYAAQRHLGKTDKQAIAYVQQLFKNVVAQPTSGSNATNVFLAGEGDVLITYESEAIAARLKGMNIQYVIPRQTLLIQLPIAVLKNSPNRDLGNTFIQFTKETPQQVIFGQNGFRPVSPAAAKQFKSFPVRPGQITLADKTLGGYPAAQKRWFDAGGIMYGIEEAAGGPSA